MNYVGVALAALSGVFYVLIKPNVQKNPDDEEKGPSRIANLNPKLKIVVGVLLSIFAGVLYGLSYAPYTHLVDNYEQASGNGLDYVLSFYTGILISSIVYYVIYSVLTKNNPYVNTRAILPSFVSGCMWGCANSCFLIANSSLNQAITFPIGKVNPVKAVGLLSYSFFFGRCKWATVDRVTLRHIFVQRNRRKTEFYDSHNRRFIDANWSHIHWSLEMNLVVSYLTD
jgi:hypothetical protein